MITTLSVIKLAKLFRSKISMPFPSPMKCPFMYQKRNDAITVFRIYYIFKMKTDCEKNNVEIRRSNCHVTIRGNHCQLGNPCMSQIDTYGANLLLSDVGYNHFIFYHFIIIYKIY